MPSTLTNGEVFDGVEISLFIKWCMANKFAMPRTDNQRDKLVRVYLRHKRKEDIKFVRQLIKERKCEEARHAQT